MLGSLIVLYYLYMGSQSRFYARWMLPLYPALAILAAYALTQIRQRVVFGALVALTLVPITLTTVRNALVLGREDTRSARDWLVANVHAGPRSCSSRSHPPSGTADPRRRPEGRPRSASGSASRAARRSSPSSAPTSAAPATRPTSRTTSARSSPS